MELLRGMLVKKNKKGSKLELPDVAFPRTTERKPSQKYPVCSSALGSAVLSV